MTFKKNYVTISSVLLITVMTRFEFLFIGWFID